MNPSRARWTLGVIIPVSILIVGFGPLLALRSELPARVASHFNLSGVPDDSMSLAGFAIAMGVMIAIGITACAGLALERGPLSPPTGPLVGFMGTFIASLGAAILAWTCFSQRGLASWQEAQGPGSSLIGMLAGSIAVGGLGAYLGSRLPSLPPSPDRASPTPAMHLGDSERAVWSTTLKNGWFLGLGVLFLVGAVAIPLVAHFALAIVPFTLGLIILAISAITARVDRKGLRIDYGILPWPRTQIPLERIASASAIDVRPMKWGGWGYRGSLTLMKFAAVVLRAGPGLRLDLHDGKVFVVTIDDPETPAALLNAEVSRNRS